MLLQLMSLPLLIGGVCIVTSIIGTYMVRLGRKQSIMGALYKGFWTADDPRRRRHLPGHLVRARRHERESRPSPPPTAASRR